MQPSPRPSNAQSGSARSSPPKIGFSDSARQLEAEVGPVKYVAEAIADFTGKEFNISQAVRIVIIILVLVFDPLAILLVIAANISIMKNFKIEDKNNV